MEENKNELQQETEVIKAVKDELLAQIQELKDSYENKINTMRAEHTNQIREILRSGSAASAVNCEPDPDDDLDDDGISAKAVQHQIDLLNKRLQRY